MTDNLSCSLGIAYMPSLLITHRANFLPFDLMTPAIPLHSPQAVALTSTTERFNHHSQVKTLKIRELTTGTPRVRLSGSPKASAKKWSAQRGNPAASFQTQADGVALGSYSSASDPSSPGAASHLTH